MLNSMVNCMPIAAMLCELKDFRITYVNQATRDNLESIKGVLPMAPDEIIGQSVDIFLKNPTHERALLSDPSTLPHKTRIEIGGEVLDLTVTAIHHKNRYVGPMLTWSVVTQEAYREREAVGLLRMLDEMPVNNHGQNRPCRGGRGHLRSIGNPL